MSEQQLSKAEMARRMQASRSALDRLLDPDNSSVTLQTLQSAAQALGGRLTVALEFQNDAADTKCRGLPVVPDRFEERHPTVSMQSKHRG